LHVPRQDIEKIQEISADHHSSTYAARSVGVEGRINDNKSSTIEVDCPAILKVVCPTSYVARRELERRFEIVLFAENARVELNSSAKES
jgi:hypothetical protein